MFDYTIGAKKMSGMLAMLSLGHKQEEVILCFISESNVFVSFPIGSGQLPCVFNKACRLQSLSFVIVGVHLLC